MGLFDRGGDAEFDEQRVVALDGATSVRASIKMAVGELTLSGGATELMNGRFRYNKELEPRIEYQVRGDLGELSIVQERDTRLKRPGRNHWEIALSDDVPLDLDIQMATGRADADLTTLRLTKVKIEHTTGETTVDLGGLQLALSEVRIDQSTGKLNLNMNGNYAVLQKVRVNSTTGELTANFAGGAWGQDLEARLDMTTGNTVIRLPRDVGVEVTSRTMLGKVSVSGLTYDGGAYRNAAFGANGPTLRLDVRTSVGKLALEVAS